MAHFHSSGHFSRAFTDQPSDEHLWDPLDRSLKFSLCAALLSQHCLMGSATLFSLDSWICLLYSGSLPSSTWVFSCPVTWKLPQDGKLRHFRANFILFSPISSHYPPLPKIQYLEKHCFIHFAQLFVSLRRLDPAFVTH